MGLALFSYQFIPPREGECIFFSLVSTFFDNRTNGRTDGKPDGQTNRWMDGRPLGRINGLADKRR